MHRTPLACGRRVRRSGVVAFAFLIALVVGVVRLPAQSRELRTLGVSNGLAAKVVSSLVVDITHLIVSASMLEKRLKNQGFPDSLVAPTRVGCGSPI